MARIKNTHLATRERYEDLDVAIRELGSLWVLDRINSGLAYNRKRKEDMREKRHPKHETFKSTRAGRSRKTEQQSKIDTI